MKTEAQKMAFLTDKLNRDKKKQRSQDTRGKIVLAGLMLAKAKTDPVMKEVVCDLLRGCTREADMKAAANLLAKVEYNG